MLLLLLALLHAGNSLAESEVLDHVAQHLVAVELDVLDLDLRPLGDEVHLAFALFFLEAEGDAADGALLDALHEVGGETSDLVSEALGLDNSDVVDNALVDVEVGGKPNTPLGLVAKNTYFP